MFQSSAKDGQQTVHRSLFWGIRCEGGKKYSQIVRQKYHISMAALDPMSVKNGKEVVSLIAERDGSEFLLCNLQKDSVLQVNLNLFFDRGEKVVFSLKGQGIVHLTGFLIQDGNDQNDSPLHSKQLNDSIILAKDKAKVSANKKLQSLKNVFSQNDSWKVESKEIVTPTAKLFASPPKKNSEKIQTNITGVLEGDNWIVESEEVQSNASPKKSASVSPSQKITPQKKLFGALKQKDEDSSEEDDEDTSEDEDDGEDAKQLLRFAQKRPISSLEEDDDDDDDDDEEDDDSDMDDSSEEEMPPKKTPVKDSQSSKKLKAETSTPLPGKKLALKNVTEIIDIDDDSKNGDMNSSIGRTPMPKKKQESKLQKVLSNSKEVSFSKDKDSSSSDSDDEVVTEKQLKQQTDKNMSVSQLNTSGEALGSEKKKKKKKKKKANAEDSTVANESSTSLKTSPSKASTLQNAQYSKKLPGGVAYEDIRIGNGPLAQKGRMVFVYYTGKLENNVIFDSCQPGRDKPFSFKLGSGSVIKGWDLSVEGMKVGGKRRIRIPPNMGYKNQRQGPIPANSTLYFIVELKAVT